MKRLVIPFILLLVTIISFTACQEESVDIIIPPTQDTLTQTSAATQLLNRISSLDGSLDNIVDSASCIFLKFPYTVVVNEMTLEINSFEDLKQIEDIYDDLLDDDDELEIIFPVVVIGSDHAETVVNSEEELEELAEACIEGGFDDDIECVDFAYPITFSVFNDSTNQASTVVVTSDKELYEYTENWDDDLVSLNFPIELILPDGSVREVNSNSELEMVVEMYEDACDEDDDNDYDDDDISDEELIGFLEEGDWVVSFYDSAEVEKTQLFEGLLFDFQEDQVVLVSNDSESFEGEWDTDGNHGVLELELDFDDGILELLDGEWDVVMYDDTTIELMMTNDDDDGPQRLTFTKN